MKFKDWLEKEDIPQDVIAKELNISQVSICYYANGQKIPRAETMQKIVTYTKGEVTANDFYDVEVKQ